MARDKKTGKFKGFAWLAYEDQRSTVLAVDNFNGIELCGRTICCDHVKQYKIPREYMYISDSEDEDAKNKEDNPQKKDGDKSQNESHDDESDN